MLLGQRQKLGPVCPAGDSALRVRRAADIGDGGAVEGLGIEAREIRQMATVGGRGHEDRLGPHRERGHRIDLIKRIRRQNDRLLAVLRLGTQRHGGVVKPLARAVQRHDTVRRDGHRIAPLQPAGDGRKQFRRALVRRVLPEPRQAVRQDIADPGGKRVLRLTNGHGKRLAPGSTGSSKLRRRGNA